MILCITSAQVGVGPVYFDLNLLKTIKVDLNLHFIGINVSLTQTDWNVIESSLLLGRRNE